MLNFEYIKQSSKLSRNKYFGNYTKLKKKF